MAKNRYVNTKFWDDSYVSGLNPLEKLVFLYLITNPLTSISGVYEISTRRIVFDTGMPRKEIEATLGKFQADGKIIWKAPWLAVRNFIKHQSLNPKVIRGIALTLDEAPAEFVKNLDLPLKVRLTVRQPTTSPRAKRKDGVRHISELIRGRDPGIGHRQAS